jgi:hypothetical protein
MPESSGIGTLYRVLTPEEQGEVVPVRAVAITEPEPFTSWPASVRERCRELWSSAGGRNSSITERLLTRESGEAPVPSASSIARWAREDGWADWSDGELQRTAGKTLRQLQAGWLGNLLLAQETLAQAMVGTFDTLPHGGVARVRAAEVTLRTIAQSGLLATLPDAPQPSKEDLGKMSVGQQSQFLRHHWSEEGERRDRR